MTQPSAEGPLDRDLDALIEAGDTVRAAAEEPAAPAAEKRAARALHRSLQEPPGAGPTPDLVPIVMERIARRTAAAQTPFVGTPSIMARLRDVLAHVALGPVAAAGALAAVLAIALFAAQGGAGGSMSGAAVGVSAPSLWLGLAAAAVLAVAALAWWLRRR